MAGTGFRVFESVKRSLVKLSWFERLERYTSPHTHPGLGVWRLIGQKFRVLAVFVVRRMAQGPGRRTAAGRHRRAGGGRSSCPW